MKFFERLVQAAHANRSLLCVGLDTDPARLPKPFQGVPGGQWRFNRAIIEATRDLVCAYKVNFAFYEAAGAAGMEALIKTREAVPPEIPLIADAKRGDIGNTAELYARSIFDTLGYDAATLHPYMGGDSLAPFLEREDKGAYILCLTSNPGASDFQTDNNLYLNVARKVQVWNTRGNCGLVVGATRTELMAMARAAAPDLPFLVPGVGAQGGSVEEACRAAAMAPGSALAPGFVVNASRSIIYASLGEDFAQAAREAAEDLRAMMEKTSVGIGLLGAQP